MKCRLNMQEDCDIDLPQKIIIDIQGGVKNFLAVIAAQRILMKLKSKAEIIGFTCAAGYRSLDETVKWGIAMNSTLKTSIPIYRGQKESLLKSQEYPRVFNYQDLRSMDKNILSFEMNPEQSELVQKEKAVDFIIRSVKKYGKSLGIIMLGSLTNLALAFLLDNIVEEVGLISVNGGQYMGAGDTEQGLVEPNFRFDPEAAAIVMEKLRHKVYINPRDLSFEWCWKEFFADLREKELETPLEKYIFNEIYKLNLSCLFWNEYTTIIPFIQKHTVTKKYDIYCEVVLDSQNMKGLLAVHWTRVENGKISYDTHQYMYAKFNQDLCHKLAASAFVKD